MTTINKLTTLIWLLFLTSFTVTNAATIDHFEISVEPNEAMVWEALDVTITAKDEDNNTIEDYEWSVLVFSETDENAEYPWELAENSYTFELSDEWSVKFENAVKFSMEWTHDLNVYDFDNEDTFWETEVTITAKKTETETADIEISSPNSGITIWKNEINISGQTVKNHKVQINVNNSETIDTVSDDNWYFEAKVDNLPNAWDSIFIANVLDSDDKVIWTSHEVVVTIDNTNPTVKSISINPLVNVEPESNVTVNLLSNKELKKVQIIVNDIITDLIKWSEENSYIGNFSAPSEWWEYKIDVIMSDELWHEVKEEWVKTLSVIKLEAAPIEEEVVEEEIVEEEIVEESTCEKVVWLKLTPLKTKSILSWDWVNSATSYKVYRKNNSGSMDLIETVTEPRVTIHITWEKIEYNDFTIKASCTDNLWNVIDSEEYSDMTRVQTGPKEVVLLLLLSLLIWSLFFIRRRA